MEKKMGSQQQMKKRKTIILIMHKIIHYHMLTVLVTKHVGRKIQKGTLNYYF